MSLIQQEREKFTEQNLEEEDHLLDQLVSETTSKTLQLVEVLKEKKAPSEPIDEIEAEEKEVVDVSQYAPKRTIKFETQSQFRINKPLAAVAIIALLFLAGIFIWSSQMAPEIKVSSNVVTIDLENSSLKQYFKIARLSKGTLYAVSEPLWNQSSDEVKKDVLEKVVSIGHEKGFDKVHVLDEKAKRWHLLPNRNEN